MKQSVSRIDDNRYVIDSCGWIEYFSDGKKAGEYAKYIEKANPKSFFTPTIVLYEVFKKILAAYDEEDGITAISHIQHTTKIVDLTDYIAISAAEENACKKLAMADAIIYATAMEKDATIVTSDTHLKGLENVLFI